MGTGDGGAVSNLAGATTLDDAALVAAARAGGPDAFEPLVRRHQRRVYSIARRMLDDPHEAEEVAQETFVRAYQSLGSFRGTAQWSTWLLSITINLCRNRRRWWARRRARIVQSLDAPPVHEHDDDAPPDEPADHGPSPAEQVMAGEQRQLLLGALQLLDATDRQVIVLRDVEALSYDAIAQTLGCPAGTVKSRLSRARARLVQLVQGRVTR